MYFVSVMKTRHSRVSRGNSEITRKEISNLFSKVIFTICRNLVRWDATKGIKKMMMDFDYCEEYLLSISKQSIIMVVLRKTNFHSVDICRLMKNQSCKKSQREKLIQTLIFSKLLSAHKVLRRRRRNVVHFILFTLKKITYSRL